MSAPSPRKSSPRRPSGGGVRRATAEEVEQAAAKQQQARRDGLVTVDSDSMVAEMTAELGRLHQQIVADRVVISRLVNHVMALDPDGAATQKLVAETQAQIQTEED